MKIAVVAASGRSGRVFVEAALAAGHEVRAGTYGGVPFQKHERLTTMDVNGTNLHQLTKLLDGADAVVSLIGHGRSSSRTIQSDTMVTIISAMSQYKPMRLVSLTGTGVRMPGDVYTLLDRILNITINLIDPKRIQDGVRHAEILQESSIDWTILRVLKLTNGGVQPFRLTNGGPAKLFTSRSEVARAIIDVLEKNVYRRAAPVISWGRKNDA